MNIATLPEADTFRTLISSSVTDRIVRDDGLMFGTKALQVGGLTPGDIRPWKVDRTTLEQLSALINKSSSGMKMRYGHPAPGAAPSTLAKASNARIIDDGISQFVAVDVKFTAASKRAGNGELRNQLFDLAEETPEDFGLSIDPLLDRSAMTTRDKDGLIPVRLLALRAIDFVDDAAATSGGLFSTDSNQAPEIRGNSMPTTAQETTVFDVLKAELSTMKAELDGLKKTSAELSTFALKVAPAETPADPKDAAKAELSRRSEITALCTLAKVNDADRDLFVSAGFSRAEAQDYLKASGKLSANNPPISEGGNDMSQKKQTDDDKFGAEYDTFGDIYKRQGITKEQFVASRKIDGN